MKFRIPERNSILSLIFRTARESGRSPRNTFSMVEQFNLFLFDGWNVRFYNSKVTGWWFSWRSNWKCRCDTYGDSVRIRIRAFSSLKRTIFSIRGALYSGCRKESVSFGKNTNRCHRNIVLIYVTRWDVSDSRAQIEWVPWESYFSRVWTFFYMYPGYRGRFTPYKLLVIRKVLRGKKRLKCWLKG